MGFSGGVHLGQGRVCREGLCVGTSPSCVGACRPQSWPADLCALWPGSPTADTAPLLGRLSLPIERTTRSKEGVQDRPGFN